MWPHWKILQDTVQTNYTGLPITLIVRNESVREGSFFDIVVSLINLIILYFRVESCSMPESLAENLSSFIKNTTAHFTGNDCISSIPFV